nr:putative ribonuclease H-like domain-containing protein [Tanacetum cinerariifolium]
MKPFGCPVTILNTLDHLGKFEGNADKGFLVGYFVNSKEKASNYEYILLPFMPLSTQSSDDKDADEVPGRGEEGSKIDDQASTNSNTQDANTVWPSINTANTNINTGSLNINIVGPNHQSMPSLEETGIFDDVSDDSEVGVKADTNNLDISTVMDVKSAFLYGTIKEEVYVCQPPGFEDPYFPNKVYKVEKALYGLHQAPRAWLQVKQQDDGIFISQDKYVANILKKFDFSLVKITSTPIETHKALLKDEEAQDVDVHLYRSMIGSLMYLTASQPDIIYLKDQPKLGLWYPKDSPFDLEAFFDSDYARARLDRKSTTGGCQFLGKRLISWQCKKKTIVANSTTEAEYVAAASCCGHVLWIQNQMLDYSQDKYVANILKKFDFSLVKIASTPIETHKALLKDEEAQDVDVHLYRSMIGSLIYLTASQPDIMFAICACARF